MLFVSDLMGRRVCDVDGQPVGRVQDVMACVAPGTLHPPIVAISVKTKGGLVVIPSQAVAVLSARLIALNQRLEDVVPFAPGENDIPLVRDVLDKQIIDVNGVRVVRVNDLDLARVDQQYYIANVDIGTSGLLRRLGLARLIPGLSRRRTAETGMITWHSIERLPEMDAVRLKVPGEKVRDLHPADLAEIISDLSRPQTARLLDSLDVKKLADTLEEIEPEFQASLVEAMPDEKVADVLEEMAPDEAADLLAELPQDRSREILRLMRDDEAADVRRLLAYAEDTVGGIMTTDFFAVMEEATAQQVLERLRQSPHEVETLVYMYVTDPEGRLLGVFSLKDLVIARPSARVVEFMVGRFVAVGPQDNQDHVAQLVSKYNLSAIPVVDSQGRLEGIVTADDALDKILPTKWKKRLPRFYH